MADVLKLPGIRRTIKVYGIVDRKQEERRRRHERDYGKDILRPHATLITSVKPKIKAEEPDGDYRCEMKIKKPIILRSKKWTVKVLGIRYKVTSTQPAKKTTVKRKLR